MAAGHVTPEFFPSQPSLDNPLTATPPRPGTILSPGETEKNIFYIFSFRRREGMEGFLPEKNTLEKVESRRLPTTVRNRAPARDYTITGRNGEKYPQWSANPTRSETTITGRNWEKYIFNFFPFGVGRAWRRFFLKKYPGKSRKPKTTQSGALTTVEKAEGFEGS